MQGDNLAQADAEETGKHEVLTHGLFEQSLKRDSEGTNFLQKFVNQYLRDSQHPMNMVKNNLNNMCSLSLPLSAYDWL